MIIFYLLRVLFFGGEWGCDLDIDSFNNNDQI